MSSKQWWEETPQEFADGFTEQREQVSILEKRKLDAQTEAWIMSNGTVTISSAQNGIETVLSPAKAYALFDLLYSHRDTLYTLAQQQ